MRGSLIFVFLAELFRLDTRSMAADPDGIGPWTSGYDPDFKEQILVDADGDGIAEDGRREFLPVRVPCQVEPQALEVLRMTAAGNTPQSDLNLVFHFRDLERLALVDAASGEAMIRPGDRLGAIYDRAGTLVQSIRNPPGLFVVEARPIGFGLFRPRSSRNLLLVSLADRPASRGMS